MPVLASLFTAAIVAAASSHSAGSPDPAVVSENVRRQLDPIYRSLTRGQATVGMMVARVSDGQELYARGADTLLVPASNIKIITSAAALHFLGADYQFRTHVYGDLAPTGDVEGDLWLKGYGDPWLLPERVWYLANRLKFLGVKRIKGDLVADDSYFAGPRLANGWEQDRTSYAYMAPTGALSVGFNAVRVHVLPGAEVGAPARVILEPAADYLTLKGTIRTVSRGRTSINVSVEPHKNRSLARLSGRISVAQTQGRGYWRRIDNPPMYAGDVLRSALAQVGIELVGSVRTGHAPEDKNPLVELLSPRLAVLVGKLNKHSNNFIAAQIARVIGAEVYGVPGTWNKAFNAVERFLDQEVGISPGTYVISNASGLHDVNALTPRQVVKVLAYMHKQPALRPEFVASLAVAGGAGTLSDRMRDTEAQNILRAKTGTLSAASALSGYITSRGGELLAFSVIINGQKLPIERIWATQDKLGQVLAELDLNDLSQLDTEGAPALAERQITPGPETAKTARP